MKVFVDAKPNSKIQKLEQKDATHFKISVKEPARDGKANEAIRKALGKHLKIPVSHITLRSGARGKSKVFEFRALENAVIY